MKEDMSELGYVGNEGRNYGWVLLWMAIVVFVLTVCARVAYGQQETVPSTPFTRTLLRAPDAPTARATLGGQPLAGTGLGNIVFDPYIGGPSYGFSPINTTAKYATNEMSELNYWTPATYALAGPRLVYSNLQTNQIPFAGGGLSSDELFTNQATLTISASIQWPPGRWVKARWNGSNKATVQPNCTAISDPLPIIIPSNSSFRVRTFLSSSAIGWPVERDCSQATGLIAAGASRQGTNDITDLTMGGTITGNANWTTTPLIIGNLVGTKHPIAVGVMGDSLMAVPTDGNISWSVDGFWESLVSNSVPFLRSTCNGAWARDVLTNEVQLLSVAPYCTHVLMEYSVNDRAGGLTALSNALVANWNFYAQKGIKVYQSTMTPVTSSSDNWQTTGNQTTDGFQSLRTNLNNWIRTTPAPLSGYLDFAAVVETATNSGVWQVNGTANWFTTDGTHWSTNGVKAAYRTVSNFVWQITQ